MSDIIRIKYTSNMAASYSLWLQWRHCTLCIPKSIVTQQICGPIE